jgi:hypothetical protein
MLSFFRPLNSTGQLPHREIQNHFRFIILEQESKIMLQDLNGLDETQRAYFQVMRAEIMASRTRGASGSGSS